ncbi:MAG: hypothetical protein ACT4TC_09340 [Myxococcaceae bacterium]
MLTTPDRRTESRRSPLPKVPEPLQRQSERRGEDRRDVTRVIRKVMLIDCANGNSQELEVYLSLEGISWVAFERPEGEAVEVLLELPVLIEPLRLLSPITRLSKREGLFEVHARFPELDLKLELALARFIEDRIRLENALLEL